MTYEADIRKQNPTEVTSLTLKIHIAICKSQNNMTMLLNHRDFVPLPNPHKYLSRLLTGTGLIRHPPVAHLYHGRPLTMFQRCRRGIQREPETNASEQHLDISRT